MLGKQEAGLLAQQAVRSEHVTLDVLGEGCLWIDCLQVVGDPPNTA